VDDFARLPSDDRRVYFEQAAARLGLSAQMVEKDFWVCWSLKWLFDLDEFRDHLTFKGGTTLSKVYKVVERFSEDVDVAIERSFLGFGGEKEPEQGASGKEQQRRIADLKVACQAAIADRLQRQLRDAFENALCSNSNWGLSIDPHDPDQQSLLFHYPSAITNLSTYFATSVKIELGARSDHFPVEKRTITPYLGDAIPESLSNAQAEVRVLAAERTFWEKATILHMLHHAPKDKKLPLRMSRHYYDVYRLAQSPIWQRAMGGIGLLDRVAVHKSIFFKVAWAHYDTARPGTLRLMPSEHLVDELRQDYLDMQAMFFGTHPTFQEIVSYLPELEERINDAAG